MSVTTQWSGTVPVDKDGSHLMNAIIWMDCRGSEALKEITQQPNQDRGLSPVETHELAKTHRRCSLFVRQGPPCHILWLKRDCSNVYERTYKFLEPKDYINLRLTGKFAATYDSILLHWVTDNRDPVPCGLS